MQYSKFAFLVRDHFGFAAKGVIPRGIRNIIAVVFTDHNTGESTVLSMVLGDLLHFADPQRYVEWCYMSI